MSKEQHPGFVNVKLACNHVIGVIAVPWTGEIAMFGEAKAYEGAKKEAAEQAKKYVCPYSICRAKHGKSVHPALNS